MNGIDYRKQWFSNGIPIRDDLDYYRDDEDMANVYLAPSELDPRVMRVLGARRFGKTSFLRRLERWAMQGRSESGRTDYHWDEVHYADLMDDELALATLADLEKNRVKERRTLVLVDEFNSIHGSDVGELQLAVERLLRRAFRGDSGDRLHIVIAAASNMDDELRGEDCPFSGDLVERLTELGERHITSLSDREAERLMTHAKREPHEPPQVERELLDYANNHPLFLHMVCDAYFNERTPVTTLADFQEKYLSKKGIKDDVQRIYDHLSRKQKLVMRYLLDNSQADTGEFTTHAAGGTTTLRQLEGFGLVESQNAKVSIKSKPIEEHMRRLPTGQLKLEDDDSTEVMTLWPVLFDCPHPKAIPTRGTWVIHHMGNLHLRTSQADQWNRDGAAIDLRKTWNAYREFVREHGKPHILVVAGDLIINDVLGPREAQIDAVHDALETLRHEFHELKNDGLMTPIDDRDSQIVVVPGDTDPLLKQHRRGSGLEQDFSRFHTVFGKSESGIWQFYGDMPITIVPLNSADLPDKVVQRLSKHSSGPVDSLNKFVEAVNRVEPDAALHAMYKEHQETDFGCLERDSEALRSKLRTLREQFRPNRDVHSERAEAFEHSLRIAVFHHHFEQLNESPAVDFWASHEIKKALAQERFSVVLNGHTLRHLVHSDTIYEDLDQDGWPFHSIGCGAMNHALLKESERPSFNKIVVHVDRARAKKRDCKYHFTIEVTDVRLVDGPKGKGSVFQENGPTLHTFHVDR